MSDKFKNAVLEAIHEIFKPQSSSTMSAILEQPDFAFTDLSDSSLRFVEFCMEIEEKTGIEIEYADLTDHPNFLGFVAWLEQQSG